MKVNSGTLNAQRIGTPISSPGDRAGKKENKRMFPERLALFAPLVLTVPLCCGDYKGRGRNSSGLQPLILRSRVMYM